MLGPPGREESARNAREVIQRVVRRSAVYENKTRVDDLWRKHLLLLLAPAVHAQAPYPSKPIRFIVGFAPGATNDLVARLLGQKLTEQLGQTVVVENRGGANTAIASAQFVRAAPDGYTLMLNSPGHLTNPSLMKLDFDSVNDFAFITQLAESVNLVIVHPSLPAKSIKELIAISKPRPARSTTRLPAPAPRCICRPSCFSI